jgi:hypothetical protein
VPARQRLGIGHAYCSRPLALGLDELLRRDPVVWIEAQSFAIIRDGAVEIALLPVDVAAQHATWSRESGGWFSAPAMQDGLSFSETHHLASFAKRWVSQGLNPSYILVHSRSC